MTVQAKMNDSDLESIYQTACECLATLHEQSETYGGRASVFYSAAGAFLQERGILKGLDEAGANIREERCFLFVQTSTV